MSGVSVPVQQPGAAAGHRCPERPASSGAPPPTLPVPSKPPLPPPPGASPVQRARKFSAVLGTSSPYSPMTTRPALLGPTGDDAEGGWGFFSGGGSVGGEKAGVRAAGGRGGRGGATLAARVGRGAQSGPLRQGGVLGGSSLVSGENSGVCHPAGQGVPSAIGLAIGCSTCDVKVHLLSNGPRVVRLRCHRAHWHGGQLPGGGAWEGVRDSGQHVSGRRRNLNVQVVTVCCTRREPPPAAPPPGDGGRGDAGAARAAPTKHTGPQPRTKRRCASPATRQRGPGAPGRTVVGGVWESAWITAV